MSWASTCMVEFAGPRKLEADKPRQSETLRSGPQGACGEDTGQSVEEGGSPLPSYRSQRSHSVSPGLAASAFSFPALSLALQMSKDGTGR